jgi:predicted PurR-regulated permease PerM
MLTGCFSYIFLNVDPASEWELRASALQAANKLIELIRAVLVQEHARSILVSPAARSSRETSFKSSQLSNKWSRFFIGYVPGDNGHSLKAKVLAVNKDLSLSDLARSLFSELVPTMAIFSQALVNVVDFYMHKNRRAARDTLVGLLREHNAHARDQVLGYINEAIRTCLRNNLVASLLTNIPGLDPPVFT